MNMLFVSVGAFVGPNGVFYHIFTLTKHIFFLLAYTNSVKISKASAPTPPIKRCTTPKLSH